MMIWMMGRGRCKSGKNPRAAIITSLAAAAGGVVTALIHHEARDGEPPKEFPWLGIGIAAAGMLMLCTLAFVVWRRKQEERGDSEEDGRCSR
jgi:hypothetical protein